MKSWSLVGCVVVLAAAGGLNHYACAAPLVDSFVQSGTLVDLTSPLVTSDSSPYPNPVPDPEPANLQKGLRDESFVFVSRSSEYTAVRTNDTTFALTNVAVAAGITQQPFPSYLVGLEYLQLANSNRNVPDFSLDITFTAPTKAYLFVDNRSNGTGNANNNPNNNEPDLGGVLTWITDAGWQRVNTGFMPNGRPDYIAIDESASTAVTPDTRSHTAANLVAGTGEGVNQYYSIYTKSFAAGLQTAVVKNGINNTNFYGMAFATDTGPAAVLGDYNNDAIVNAADYVAWREAKSTGATTLTNRDPSRVGNPPVDDLDYTFWKSRFGATSGSGAVLASAAIPEPGVGCLALIATVICGAARRRD